MIEMICAMAVAAVIAAAAVPLCAGWISTAGELRIREEAHSIRDSVQLYVLAHGDDGKLDGMMLLEQVSDVPVASPANPIRPYLMFEPSKDLKIENVTLDQRQGEVKELVLVSKRYRVTISSDKTKVERR